jgi:hypothetical protein
MNFLYWQAQIVPSLSGAEVMELLDGSDHVPTETLEQPDGDKTRRPKIHPIMSGCLGINMSSTFSTNP